MQKLIFGAVISTGSSVAFALLLIILFWSDTSVDGAYRRNSEIFNIGWIWSVPYDIGNTLRAPLAGPLSLILTAALSVIMFFGLAVSPVYYLLGTPYRKYHVQDVIQTIPFPVRKSMSRSLNFSQFEGHDHGRSFDSDQPADLYTISSYDQEDGTDPMQDEIGSTQESINSQKADGPPDFVDSIFFFLPEKDENCKKLLLCHSHGFLGYLPTFCLQIYRAFSKKMFSIPKEYQTAIQIGLEDQGDCVTTYHNCTRDVATIAQDTFLYNFLGDSLSLYYFPETANTESTIHAI